MSENNPDHSFEVTGTELVPVSRQLPNSANPGVIGESVIHPSSELVEPTYRDLVDTRKKLTDFIRAESSRKAKLLDDIVETVFAYDKSLPTGPTAFFLTVVTFGKTIRERRRRKEAFKKVIGSLLEKVFDPPLEFKMTTRDILDTLEANGIDRETVALKQINQIYVQVLECLKQGNLRDLIFGEQLLAYVEWKIKDIETSRDVFNKSWI